MAGITDLALRIIIGAENRTGPVFKHAKDGIQSISDSLARVETLAKRVLDFRLFIGWAQEAFKLSDSYASIQGRLRQVVGESGNLVAVQNRLFAISQQAAAPLEDTVRLYARSAEALKNYANSQALAAKLTETVGLSFKAQASSAAEISSTITQLTQAIGGGTVQWEDFGQLADTNLKLVNVAAKNLGYQGISDLKAAMSAGRVTGIALTEALVAGFDEIKAAADKMPISVAGSYTLLQNALLKYVGESNNAGVATRALSSTLQTIAANIEPIASAVLIMAAAYGGKLVSGLFQSAQAYVLNMQAAKAKAAADADELKMTAALASARAKAVAVMLEEATLYAKLVAGTEKEAAAKAKLTAAINAYHAANTKAQAANAAISGSAGGAAEKLTGLAGAFQLVGKVASGLFTAGLLTAGISGLLDMFGQYNEKFRIASFAWQAAIEKLKASLAHFFSGDFITADKGTLAKQFDEIDRKFGDLAVASTDAAQKQTDAAKKTSEAQTKAAEETAKAIGEQIKGYKALADAAKDSAEQQLKAVDAQQQKVVRAVGNAITDEGGVDRSGAREAAITRATITAEKTKSTIIATSTKERLRLIDEAHAKEVEAARKANTDTKDIDQKWLQSKEAVLKEWQGAAQHSVDQLISLEEKHRDAAAKIDNEIYQHKAETQKKIDGIKIDAKPVENYGDIMSLQGDASLKYNGNINNALKKGDTAAALRDAKLLEQAYADIADKAKQAFDAGFIDEGQLNAALYDFKKVSGQVDEINQQQADEQKQAAEEAAAALAEQQKTVVEASTQVDEMQAKLKETIGITVDASEIDAVDEKIKNLPKEVQVVIKAVQEGGWPGNNGGDVNVPGHASGVRLPGFGGGDILPAMLEPGEGVVNKYGMRALDKAFGGAFFDQINAGANPVDLIRRHLSSDLRIQPNITQVDFSKIAGTGGTPINIHLPGGQKFGPFNGNGDTAAALANVLKREAIKRGRRT